MRNIWRAIALLLLGPSILLLAQNPAGLPSTTDQNSILNMYDAFGYQKRGTILDWGFSALIHYNDKTILFDTGNSADKFEHNVKALGVNNSPLSNRGRRRWAQGSRSSPTWLNILPAEMGVGTSAR
jgi:hypothetical protein